MTNVESEQAIRGEISENGQEYFPDQSTLLAFFSDQKSHYFATTKTEELEAEVSGIGVVSGLVVCRAAVEIPFSSRTVQIENDGNLGIGIALAWKEEPNDISEGGSNISRAVYVLREGDAERIDRFYQEQADAGIQSTSPEYQASATDLGDITFKYEQTTPPLRSVIEVTSGSSTQQAIEERAAKRVEIIRAFKDQHAFLTILSTTESGNIHDDEIPLLAEWLVK
ncbi:MAG: hypothetical protein ACHQT9_02880 [Candidatus Saccharimonadales bacterium]